MDRIHDLLRGVARLRQFVGRDAPDVGHMLPRLGVQQGALAGQLIAFLPVFAASLAVALPGDHGAAAAFPPQVSGGQRQVDQRGTILHALRLVLQTARVQGDGTLGFGEQMRGLFNRFRRHSGHLGRHARIVAFHRSLHRFETGGVRGDERVVLQVVAQHDVEHSIQQRQIGARAQRKKEVGVARDGSHAGVCYDQFASVVAAPPDVIGSDGSAVSDVRADGEQHLRFRNLAPGNRAAVHVEGQLIRRSGGHHAKAAVVIDVAGSQRYAGELSHQIRLLGGERRPSVDRHRILAVTLLHLAETTGGEGKCLVPASLGKSIVRAEERVQQAIGMIGLQVAFYAFGTQHAPVERKLLPGLESDHAILANLQLNAALLAAETAVRLHQAVRVRPRLRAPATFWNVVEVRSVLLADLVQGTRSFSHEFASSVPDFNLICE